MADKEPLELSEQNPVGGLAFFTSLLFLCFLAVQNSFALLAMQQLSGLTRWAAFLSGAVAGYLLAQLLFPERFCVFIHELKHSIVSNLAGNRAKKFKVADASGSFTYEYTKKTAAYNAFIALAPYWFPLFSLVGLPLLFLALRTMPLGLLAGIGILWGSDCALNARDVSPHQSDIHGIRGGYLVGLLYILAMNVTIFTILAAWVTADYAGLMALGKALWDFLHRIATALLGI